MMNNFIVTISREYGSGGHDIGKKLAELLQIPFYDREVVEMTVKKYHLDAARLDEMEDQSKKPLPFGMGGGYGAFTESDDRMFVLQSQTVLELAKKPCVIVGRCADYILQEHPSRYSFFIYSSMKQRLSYMAKHADTYQAKDFSRETIKMDRRRAAYYKYHTGLEWGKPANYHLCIDSGVLGPKTAEVLATFVQLKESMKAGDA